jgi:glycosyltransferase involved in cell wall biosynthesis
VLTTPVGDAVALADRIERLAYAPSSRAELGERARATVATCYTAAAALPALADAYRRFAAPRLAAAPAAAVQTLAPQK